MSTLTILAVFSAASVLGASDSDTYAEAHQATVKTGKPMVVMVSTEWCAPCQVMKRTIIPRVRQHGLLSRVAFAIVNPDHDRELAEQLTGGGPVPQLVMFRQTPDGWKRRKLIGGQSVEAVEEFIQEGVTLAESDKAKTEDAKNKTAKKDSPAGQEQKGANKDKVVQEKPDTTDSSVVRPVSTQTQK